MGPAQLVVPPGLAGRGHTEVEARHVAPLHLRPQRALRDGHVGNASIENVKADPAEELRKIPVAGTKAKLQLVCRKIGGGNSAPGTPLELCKTDAPETYQVVRGPARAAASAVTPSQLGGHAWAPRQRASRARSFARALTGPVPSQVVQPCQRKRARGPESQTAQGCGAVSRPARSVPVEWNGPI